MSILTVTLQLATDLAGSTRTRCPDLKFADNNGQVTGVRSDTEQPTLPYSANSITAIRVESDALCHVIDEEIWLAELSRVLIPGGHFQCTLPAMGAFAWLDAMNLYRYIVDISGRGDLPDAVLPAGWNKHYSRLDISQLFGNAGFEDIAITPTSHAVDELRMLFGLIAGNWLRQDRTAEQRLFGRYGRRIPEDKHPGLPTAWIVSARKCQ